MQPFWPRGTADPAPAELLSEDARTAAHRRRDERWGSQRPQAIEGEDEPSGCRGADDLDADEEETHASLRADRTAVRRVWVGWWSGAPLPSRPPTAHSSASEAVGPFAAQPLSRLGLRQALALFLMVGITGGGCDGAKVSDLFTPTPTEPSVADLPSASALRQRISFTLQWRSPEARICAEAGGRFEEKRAGCLLD